MPVDTALLALSQPIESEQPWPRPRCPNCDSGHIRFEGPTETESHATASLHNHEAFDPEWIRGTFTVRGACENPGCRQVVTGTGDYDVESAVRDDPSDPWGGALTYVSSYRLAHIHPPLLLMPIPQAAPDEVREGVLRASRVLFADAGLAATALRAAVERFLTLEGVPATDASGRFRTAHKRIQTWEAADPTRAPIAALLYAVKWLGNAGTHEDSDLTIKEVLRGAVVLDEALHRHYTGPDIDATAQRINVAEGPDR